MATLFDPENRRIILDVNSVSASQLWIDWSNWVATSDNAKYLPAMKQVGGDSLGSGLFIPPYIFLLNDWRVRPMESNHDLIITGNLFVEGGGTPVVRTLGAYQVNVSYTVPVQAQGISTSGVSAPTVQEIVNGIMNQASATPIHADTRKMNGAFVYGSGVSGDQWRGNV